MAVLHSFVFKVLTLHAWDMFSSSPNISRIDLSLNKSCISVLYKSNDSEMDEFCSLLSIRKFAANSRDSLQRRLHLWAKKNRENWSYFRDRREIQSQKRNLAWIYDRSKAIAVFTIYCTNHIINQPKLISRNSEVASLGSWRRKFFYCKWTKITQIFLKLVLSPFYFVTASECEH